MKSIAAFLVVALIWFSGLLAFAGRVQNSAPRRAPAVAQGIVALTGANSSERISAAMGLLEDGYGRRVLVSGVDPIASRADIRRVSKAVRRLYDCCVDLGFTAADTVGNARETAAWAQAMRYEKLIVVTADYLLESGGLHIIGTERHESRRIDNQLRGRAGRQGDPGSTRFYLSLEDNLMRIFASDRVSALMQKLGMKEGEAIEHPWVTKAIVNAQRKVEAHNFDIRKQLLEYDDVANDQRKVVYQQRNELMAEDDISETIADIRRDVIGVVIETYIPANSLEEQWDVGGLEAALESEFGQRFDIKHWLENDAKLNEETLRERILQEIADAYHAKENLAGVQVVRHFEKSIMLQVLDQAWKEHLAAMDYLRQGIGLRGYAQKNPKQEYKREAFQMFSAMLERIKHDVVSIVSKVQVRSESDVAAVDEQRRQTAPMQFQHADASAMASAEDAAETGDDKQSPHVRGRKVGRNDPCPCGSGKKYKQCHGQLQ
jgi:preprotein translocase subunit SecA